MGAPTPETASYRRFLRPLAAGWVTSGEVACRMVVEMAFRGEAELFREVYELTPVEVQREMMAYLHELIAVGFDQVVLGPGVGPRTDEEFERVREWQRVRFRAVAMAAGLLPSPNRSDDALPPRTASA